MFLEQGAVALEGGCIIAATVLSLFVYTCLLFFRACFCFLLLFEDGDLGWVGVEARIWKILTSYPHCLKGNREGWVRRRPRM